MFLQTDQDLLYNYMCLESSVEGGGGGGGGGGSCNLNR